MAGYLNALSDSGIEVDPDLVSFEAGTVADAAAVTRSLLRAGKADAVFAANNRTSLGVLQAFAAEAKRLPLVGFDDFDAAQTVIPAVTVVSQDVAEMGKRAAGMILERVNTHEAGPSQVAVLPVRLIRRGSELPA